MTTEKPQNIRFVGEEDREKLLNFVREGHDESAMFSLSDAKVKSVISHAINPPRADDGGVNHLVMIGIIDAPDKDTIAASLAIEYTQPWYSEDWVLYELWNNVRPAYRKYTYANDLIKFGKWLSDSTGRPLGMQIYTTERVTPKIELYRRKMLQVGALFVYNMQKATGPAIEKIPKKELESVEDESLWLKTMDDAKKHSQLSNKIGDKNLKKLLGLNNGRFLCLFNGHPIIDTKVAGL